VKRVLIANRGEIAVRILRTCKEMGFHTIAVYSEADRDALHVALSDEAHLLGPAPARESYLNIERLLQVARRARADMVHPGYGFLSENADFAAACRAQGLIFVGPSPETIRQLGDKCAARALAERIDVPTVPGYTDDDMSERRLLREAKRIGTPLILKAAGGGGGRGMRIVSDLAQLPEALAAARGEALAAFGDERIFLERYIPRARHVEVQILGDSQGNVIHLFERECSVQRRYQKIVEESPSCGVNATLRKALTEAAVRIAKAANYVGAGTVEFLVEANAAEPRFYFLEVNTRLQVEHPVTEAVTGLDLVRLQFHVAQGRPLPYAQEDISLMGHAIEVRLCAEDPANHFLASPGTVRFWQAPEGPGIRVDTALEIGSFVSPYYDPLLAKIIAFGRTRDEALARLERALMETHGVGVKTNLAYLLDIIRHRAFREGDLSTRFLEEHFAEWKPSTEPPEEVLLALAAASVEGDRLPALRGVSLSASQNPLSPWYTVGRWRNT